MKFNKFIIIFILCNFTVSLLHASECYHYHTRNSFKLIQKDTAVFFQHTVKDLNLISYVSQKEILLKGITSTGFVIVSETDKSIIFSNIDGYFLVPKKIYQVEKYGAKKIANKNEVIHNLSVYFFNINNQWKYIENIDYSSEIKFQNVQLPTNLELISDFPARKLLLKNEKYVYVFDTEKLKFTKIPNLIGKNAKFFKIKNRGQTSNAFLYDNDTFYEISVHDIKEVTKEFLDQEPTISFEHITIHQFENNVSIDGKNGFLWLYKENGLLHKKKGYSSIPIHFVRKKASYFNSYKELIVYENKVYNDFYDLVSNRKSIDIDAIENYKMFHKEGISWYTDGVKRYTLDYKNKKMLPIHKIGNYSTYIPRKIGYQGIGNNEMFLGEAQLFLRTDSNEILVKKPIEFYRDFSLFTAYNDRLIIENNDIKNLADIESMEFLGSIVDVLSGCDAMDDDGNYYAVEIDVYYFFKDVNGYYVYNSEQKKMRRIRKAKSMHAKMNRFTYLQSLMNQVKKLMN